MKVLMLSPYPHLLHRALEEAGDTFINEDMPITSVDFVVSLGHPRLISGPMLTTFKDRIINIHISLLPWNRGADPNFWSWFDDTPKGVTIHRIDAGIDTGNILAQREITKWHEDETLNTSWHCLMAGAKGLFEDEWKNIRRDALPSRRPEGGSYHKGADKDPWFKHLPLGWKTPVSDIKRLGREHRAPQLEKEDPHSGTGQVRR